MDIYDPVTKEFLGTYDPSIVESSYDVQYGERRELRVFQDRDVLSKYLGQCEKNGKEVHVEYRRDTWDREVRYTVETRWREARVAPPQINWTADGGSKPGKKTPPPPKTNRQWLNEQVEAVCRLARAA